MTPSDGKELTWRGIALGVALTVPFTAANIYLGLKVGLTFATSIPAAVISMALLGLFRGSNVRENNIVQTVCSAAGTLGSIIFVLPGLVIVGYWTGFPFWASFLLCASGGVLGVLFTIPLRRALVTHSDLPYPEGVAGAEVLRVGSDTRARNPEAREGLTAVIYGSLASAGLAVVIAMRLALDGAAGFFRLGGGASGYSFSFSLALLGAGHLVGISVGTAMILGIVIAWGGAVPLLTAMTPLHGDLGSFVTGIWRNQVRFIGAGAMAVAAIWSLVRMMGPILAGLSEMVSARALMKPGDQTDRDIPLNIIIALAGAATLVTTWLVWRFSADAALGDRAILIAVFSIPLILGGGFLIAAICGYMAGLIGSSNSPISGVGILAVVGTAVCLAIFFGGHGAGDKPLVAVALFITAILFAVACSSNDNLQDLKTGQLVGAAPWRQQVALLVGVAAASLTIPFVLNLLAQAYGFAGAANLHTVTAQPLAAPQANLISALAQGVIGGKLSWNLIGIGVVIGIAIVMLDEMSRMRGWLRIPPLAVGFGIYLPMEATLPVALGAVIGWLYNRKARSEHAKRLGVLVASGLIVGESLFGVINAGLIVSFNHDAPLSVVPGGFGPATAIGPLGFAALIVLLYGWLLRRARRSTS
jgi:putative OPT family oligopeptide transporter